MANTILFVMFLTILSAALSFPALQDTKSVQSRDMADVDLTDRNVVFRPGKILSQAKYIEQVKSLDNVTFDVGVRRSTREAIKGNNKCAQGMRWILDMCVTLEKYNELKEDYDEDITAQPEDKKMTSRSRTTPHPVAVQQPRPTMRHRMPSHHRKSLRHHKTPRRRKKPRPQKKFPQCHRRQRTQRGVGTRCCLRHLAHRDDVQQCRRQQRCRRRHQRHRKNRRVS